MKTLALTLMLSSLAAFGQPGYFRPSNPFSNAQRGIDGIQQDLYQIGQRAAWDGWARRQFRDAIDNIERFQRDAYRGRPDYGRLNRAVVSLNRLLTAPELHWRDKQRIAFHRDQLQRLCGNGGGFGGYWR
jgi:hypothetical protein